ncbi:hypothetical protein IV203_037792 [Nitzschia inconspicua]|uniref:Transmembrane protein n=1 Tax=Nitzschia inconspicua TaxID=303405 RepID=A0A9K3LMI4_9STRA|nr:hypothetical protein IV203_037792 [Nitzschia inconspicua]
MSLATSGGIGGMGGGAGAGGLSMAHSAHAMAQPMQANVPPPSAEIPAGMAPPSNLAALGADIVDKSQQLSLKQVRDLSEMPIVAIDLYSTEPVVASVPPKPKDPAAEDVKASVLGKMKDKIFLKSTEAAHKTLRKWLSKSKGYDDLRSDVFASPDDTSAVVIENPELWLGLRRLEDGPAYLKKMVTHVDDTDSLAIAEEAAQGVGVSLANGTLDGSVPQGDDFDRVVCKVRLHESKKALTILPEEILQLILNQAQYYVARKNGATGDNKDGEDVDDITSYPCAIAVPAPYCNDQSVEALLDATGNTGVVFQRSVCALAGALVPSVNKEKPNLLLVHLQKVLQERQKEFQKEQIQNPDATFDDSILLLMAGMTKDTAECTAIQISSKQESMFSCLYGNFQVMCSVSYRHENPESILEKCVTELFEALDTIAPEADAPFGIISFGTGAEQKTVQTKWEKLKKGLEDWEQVPHFFTKADCVATGTGILGAVSHGRLSTIVQIPGKKRPKTQLGIQVQNVAPVAVGVTMNYHGGAKDRWTPVKTIFDFDRRVPAGPYGIELSAAECTLHREGKASELSEEAFVKAIKDREAAKHIPEREKAALDLRVQVVQKFTRDGSWTKIGDVMSPLTVVEKDESKTACEKITLELGLGISGLITNALVGDRASVVQATKSARISAIQWYLGIGFAILFFGGFLVKSYWEEHVFERDTRRLLAYYKHVVPGSMSDGDLQNARYLVWKYRYKKQKLWKNLEKKYGEPVLEEHEWSDEDGADEKADGDDHHDLDGGDTESGDTKDEPDL